MPPRKPKFQDRHPLPPHLRRDTPPQPPEEPLSPPPPPKFLRHRLADRPPHERIEALEERVDYLERTLRAVMKHVKLDSSTEI